MDPVRRKFKSDISDACVNKLIEKRQRKRGYFVKRKTPYGDYTEAKQQAGTSASSNKLNLSVVDTTPVEMLQTYERLHKVDQRREREIPNHWLRPEKKTQISKEHNLEMEEANIQRSINSRATYSLAARKYITARGQKLRKPSDRVTAKGYLSNRSENKEATKYEE